MARRIVRVCDICSAEDVSRYTVGHRTTQVTADLCPTHAAPLEEILSVRGGAKDDFVSSRIVTIEELERLKAEGRA